MNDPRALAFTETAVKMVIWSAKCQGEMQILLFGVIMLPVSRLSVQQSYPDASVNMSALLQEFI